MIDEKNIPADWIRQKFIQSGRYRGTIVETGAKVILRYWHEHCEAQARKESLQANAKR